MIPLTTDGLVRNEYPERDLLFASYRGNLSEVLRTAAPASTGTLSDEFFIIETASGRTHGGSNTCYQFASGGHGICCVSTHCNNTGTAAFALCIHQPPL